MDTLLLKQDDVVHTAEGRRALGCSPPADAYDAACLLARCISIVATHDQLNDSQRNAAARFYGDAAMKTLQDAVSKGYKDVAKIREDRNLAPLRERDDFKKLLAERKAKGT